VEIGDKLNLLLMLGDELSQRLGLRLGKGTWSSVALAAGICAIVLKLSLLVPEDLSKGLCSLANKADLGLLSNTKVNGIVAVKVNSRVLILTLISLGALRGLWAHIFSFFDDLSSLFKLSLDQRRPIHVDDWQDVINVLHQEILELWVTMDHALVQELEC
jgi:hypothetical protein